MTDRETAEQIVDQFPGPLPAYRNWWIERVAEILQRAEAAERERDEYKADNHMLRRAKAFEVKLWQERTEKAERERDAMKSELNASKEAFKSAR